MPQSFDLSSAFRTQVLTETNGPGTNGDSSREDQSGNSQRQPDSGGRQQQQRRQNSAQHLRWMQAMEDQV
jgi:hypothetical protein